MWIPEYTADFGGAIADQGHFRIISNFEMEVRRYAYSIKDGLLTDLAARNVPTPVLDLVDILRFIPLVDRRAPRTWPGDSRPPEQRGPRRLVTPFPVREPDFWRAPSVTALLQRLLWYLSGDQLDPSFLPILARPISMERQARLPLPLSIEFESVTLLSGGLDSLFGLSWCAEQNPPGHTLAVSVHTHRRQLALQSRLVNALNWPRPHGLAKQVAHAPVSISLARDLAFRESSQKTRVLMFLASGILAVIGADLDRLVVSENGPGALNLPSSAVFGGPQLNRAMHPTTLGIVAELVSLALQRPFSIENIGLRFTKRQMVALMRAAGLDQLLSFTVSCDRFPHRSFKEHCGRCSSCLLRALAMLDMPVLFDRLGLQNRSRHQRLASMASSTAYAHLVMMEWQLADLIRSKNPFDRLWAMQQNIKDLRAVLDNSSILTMLELFRQDISDLVELVDGKQGSDDAITTAELAAVSGS